jgi:O-antigen/teichoic acid export membrane protein
MIKVASGLAALSIASQGIALLALPVVALFYTPGDFNHLAAFSSISMILITISALRMEMAIPIVQGDDEAASLVWLSGLICLSISLATLVALLIFLPLSAVDPTLKDVLFYLPFAVFFGGLQAILISVALRQKKLLSTGVTRLVQTVLGLTVQIAIGYWAFLKYGLVIGLITNIISGAILLFFINGAGSYLHRFPGFATLREVAWDNRDYARFSALDAFLNVSSLQLPLFLISSYGDGVAGGFLFLAIRLFYTPSTIISGAFAKIYHSSVGKALRDGQEHILTMEALRNLLTYGGAFVIAGTILGPDFVVLLLGNEWAPTGALLTWMAPWILLQLLASPISTIMLASGRQKQLLALTIFGFVLRGGSVFYFLFTQPALAPIALAVTSSAFYAICLLWFARVSRLRGIVSDILQKRVLVLLGGTLTGSIAVKVVLNAFV